MTYMSSTTADARINARLDAQSAAQLEYLTATTGLGVSEVVRASLAYYYQAQRTQASPQLLHLRPLVGRFRSGQPDTSGKVKQVVADYLAAKQSGGSVRPAAKGRR